MVKLKRKYFILTWEGKGGNEGGMGFSLHDKCCNYLYFFIKNMIFCGL